MIEKVGGCLDAHSGGRTHMKLERAAVNAWKKVPAEPRNQNRERAKAAREEHKQKGTPLVKASLQQAAIAVTESLEGLFKTLLKPNERIAAGGISFVLISSLEGLCHGRGDQRRT